MTPVILETGVETTVSAIRSEHPGLMFGQGSDLSHIGIGWLVETPRPAGNYQRGPNELVDGQWQMTWAEYTPEPEVITQFSSLNFLERFTSQEQLAVVSATMANAQVKLWYDKLLAANFVDVADPRTAEGLAFLVAAGLLSQERASEILG
jgi:hypothetical protein